VLIFIFIAFKVPSPQSSVLGSSPNSSLSPISQQFAVLIFILVALKVSQQFVVLTFHLKFLVCLQGLVWEGAAALTVVCLQGLVWEGTAVFTLLALSHTRLCAVF
jgi:hypothetical protein